MSSEESAQVGVIPLMLLIAGVGVIIALVIFGVAPFRNNLLSTLYPKPHSHAAVGGNLNLPTNLPSCASVGILHNRTKYHSLVHFQNSEDPLDPNRGNPVCHWDHTHGFNPNDANLVNKTVSTPNGPVAIGPVGALTYGQSISYPWQTFKGAGETPTSPPSNPADLENGFKHNFYAWIVRTNMPCTSNQSDATGCFTDFRWQEHADVSYIGALSRFHSFSADARACLVSNPSDCGIIRTGGWIDYGFLHAPDDSRVPLPGDPSPNDPHAHRRLHQAVKPDGQGGLKLCGDFDTLNGVQCFRNGDVTWYGATRGPFSDGFNAEGYGPVNPANPSQKLLYSDFGVPHRNGSWHKAEIFGFSLFPWDDDLDGKIDGRVNFKGYHDRYGTILRNSNCTAPGLDCVPLELINVPIANYLYRESFHNPNMVDSDIDVDITPPGIPSWIVYNDTYVPDPSPGPSQAPTPSPSAQASIAPSSSPASGIYETYSANLTPVSGTGSSGSGKYTFDLMCNPETSGPYAGQYMAYPKTTAPDTYVTNLLGNPYNAHIHYTSSAVPMKGIIVKNDPPVGVIQPVSWLTQMTIANTFTLAPAFTASERNEVRYQPAVGRPGTWVNIHTNACPACQGGELQGDVKKISGDCSAVPSSTPAKPGDIDRNNKVDIFDYNILLTDFGKTGNLPADIDKNGKVDIFDFNILLTNFGK